jgi:hypothetical protein
MLDARRLAATRAVERYPALVNDATARPGREQRAWIVVQWVGTFGSLFLLLQAILGARRSSHCSSCCA